MGNHRHLPDWAWIVAADVAVWVIVFSALIAFTSAHVVHAVIGANVATGTFNVFVALVETIRA